MHLSRSSSPEIFHYFVAGILVASIIDGTRILHGRFRQFPRRPQYEVLIYKHEKNDHFFRKRCRFFLALGADFCEEYIHLNCHIFVKICLSCLHIDDCVIISVCLVTENNFFILLRRRLCRSPSFALIL